MEYQKMLQRAEREKQKIPNYIDELVDNYDFNTLIRQRWLKGKRPDGTIIGKYKKSGGIVDLTDTGEMGREIELFEIKNNVYAFGSGVEYYDKIVDMFGLDNFNITQKETFELFDFIMLKVQEKYLNNVYLI